MNWILRGFIIGFVLLIIAAGVAGILGLRYYERARNERIAQLQKKAEETQVTLIEGWTVNEMAGALEKAGLGPAASIVSAAKTNIPTDNNYIKIPAKQGLEGYLFPDTYRFAKSATTETVIKKLLDNFTARVDTLGIKPADSYTIPGYETLTLGGKKGMTFHQIITLASILEKESGTTTDNERKLIAGVFYNRLISGQPLESDATVNYVSGKDNPTPTNVDLQINSPYNTYRYPGLPPGPICNPSLASIEAAFHPEQSDYYYFLHKQPSGEVVFSKTYAEHLKNKALYLK